MLDDPLLASNPSHQDSSFFAISFNLVTKSGTGGSKAKNDANPIRATCTTCLGLLVPIVNLIPLGGTSSDIGRTLGLAPLVGFGWVLICQSVSNAHFTRQILAQLGKVVTRDFIPIGVFVLPYRLLSSILREILIVSCGLLGADDQSSENHQMGMLRSVYIHNLDQNGREPRHLGSS
ncbi:hypothetical protein RCL_jg25545.t1 [Rhizophagus clarus]|uniref:Uncharacterized protein n=1 Tax=Rhizophagus clarus TaxID=94130 RepID=A0A8H3LGK6_9GLOM|nr:hypothetical protein RCL_jg25545.t1 [Rhizophagus clarus]